MIFWCKKTRKQNPISPFLKMERERGIEQRCATKEIRWELKSQSGVDAALLILRLALQNDPDKTPIHSFHPPKEAAEKCKRDQTEERIEMRMNKECQLKNNTKARSELDERKGLGPSTYTSVLDPTLLLPFPAAKTGWPSNPPIFGPMPGHRKTN